MTDLQINTFTAMTSAIEDPCQNKEATFLDLLATVPHLLECCFKQSWHNKRVRGICNLRRVSKEGCRIALTAVKHCSVSLGHREFMHHQIYPASLVKVMRTAQLQQLRVAIGTTTGGEVNSHYYSRNTSLHQSSGWYTVLDQEISCMLCYNGFAGSLAPAMGIGS